MAAAKTARTQGKLAAAVGKSQQAVSKWIRNPLWPFGDKGPWDVAKVKAWAAQLQEDRAAAADEPKQPSDAAKISQGAKLERMLLTRVQRRRLEGSLVDRQLLDRALEGLAKLFVAGLDELERSLPYNLAGLDTGTIERIVRERIRAVRTNLSNQTVIELQQVQHAIAVQNQPKARGRPGRR